MPPRPHRAPTSALSRLLVGSTLLLAGGCRAAGRPPEPPQILHWPVPAPAPLQAAKPVLWVALAARLAPQGDPVQATPLRLRAASGSLTLTDAAGRRFTAPELALAWRRQPLATPIQIRRQVQGPFPSFESAEQAARAWATAGGEVRIARSRDWEIWSSPGLTPPAGVVTRLVEERPRDRLVLELRRPTGAVVLEGPLRLVAPAGLAWQSGVYPGPFRLQADAHGSWTLVEEVPLERYLEGVVPHEIGAAAPPAALAAQAVLARTWAVRNRHRFLVDGYHLCADTQCQVYSDPRHAGATVRQAIATSRGQVLVWRGEPIHAVYHASNGGVSAGFEEVWSGSALPYLRPALDGPPAFVSRWFLPLAPASLASLLRDGGAAYGSDHPRFRWQRLLTPAALTTALAGQAARLGAVQRLEVAERGASGRVVRLRIVGAQGSLELRRDAIRRTFRQLPSTLFTVRGAAAGGWLLEGGGFGHGAGLSQAGAIDLGRRGWSAARILGHYYPGTELQSLRLPGGAP